MHHNYRKRNLYSNNGLQSIVPKLDRKKVERNLDQIIEHSNKLAEDFKKLYSEKKEERMQKLEGRITAKRREVQLEKDKIIEDQANHVRKTYAAKQKLFEKYGESLKDGTVENEEYNKLCVNAENKAYQTLRDYRQKSIELERWVEKSEEQCLAPLRSYAKSFLDNYKKRVTQDKQAVLCLISKGKYEGAQSKIEMVKKAWDKMVGKASEEMPSGAGSNKRNYDGFSNDANNAVYFPPAKRQKIMSANNQSKKLSNVKNNFWASSINTSQISENDLNQNATNNAPTFSSNAVIP